MALTDYKDYARIGAGDDPNILGLLPAPNNDAGIAVDPIGALWLYVNTNAPGSKWVKQEEHYIKHVDNYTALRALSNYTPSAVILRDFTYAGPDGNTYTTLGGVFYKATSGTEDGGTTIVGNYIWKRDWDGINVRPEWWEAGGFNLNGVNFTNKNTAGGIYNDADRLIAAGNLGSNLQLLPNKIYDDIDVSIKVKCESVSGNNATLRRITTPAILTTAISNIGATTVTVADTSLYRVGQVIFFVNPSAPSGGLAFGENVGIASLHKITSISGNIITFLNPLIGNVGLGWKVILYATLLDFTDQTDNGLINITGVNFDGNRVGNSHCFDFRVADDISASNTDDMMHIDNCFFINSVLESIVYGKIKLTNSGFNNLGGSWVHTSANTQREGMVVIENCFGKGSNQISNLLSTHSESTISSSANTTHVRIINCNFEDGNESVFNHVGENDFDLIVSNNHFKDYKSIFITFTSTKKEKKININNNIFDNCGPFTIEGSSTANVQTNTTLSHIKINDNIFINSNFNVSQAAYIWIENNKFLWDASKITKWDYSVNSLNGQDALYRIAAFDRVHVINNVLEQPITYQSHHQYCLLLQHQNIARKTSVGALTDYLYATDVKVNGNTFGNVKFGICTIPTGSPQNANLVLQAVGWEYKNNIIYMSRSTGAGNGTGIFVDPGVVCEGNMVYTNNIIPCYTGILGAGVGTTGNAHNRILGAIVNYNKVIGCAGSTGADILANADGVRYNVTCIGNMTRDDIFNATNGHFSDNYKITATLYPSLTSLGCPEYRYAFEDSNQY